MVAPAIALLCMPVMLRGLSAALHRCSARRAWPGRPSVYALVCRSMRFDGSQWSAASAHRSDEDRVAGHRSGVHLPASRSVVCIPCRLPRCSLNVHYTAQDTDPIVSNAGSHGLISTQARAAASPVRLCIVLCPCQSQLTRAFEFTLRSGSWPAQSSCSS